MVQKISSVGFFEPIRFSSNTQHEKLQWLGKTVEKFFDFGQDGVKIVAVSDKEGVKVVKEPAVKPWATTAKKMQILAYTTLLLPITLLMLAGRALYRLVNKITVVRPEKPAQNLLPPPPTPNPPSPVTVPVSTLTPPIPQPQPNPIPSPAIPDPVPPPAPVETLTPEMKLKIQLLKQSSAFDYDQLVKIVEYIEKNNESWKTSSNPYISKQVTNLPCSLLVKGDNCYILLKEKLGEGSFRKYRSALHYETGEVLAIGKSPLEDPENPGKVDDLLKEYTTTEIEVLEKLKGTPGIVETHEVIRYKGAKSIEKSAIVQKKYPLSLLDYYNKVLRILPPGEYTKATLAICNQILQTVAIIHKKGILHSDLRMENVMIEETKDGPKTILIDFGLAVMNTKCPYTLFSTTTAPELWPLDDDNQNKSPGKATNDIWGLGCIFYTLHNKGKQPNWLIEVEEMIKDEATEMIPAKISESLSLMFPKKPKDKNSMDYLIWKMLEVKPKARPTMKEILGLMAKIMSSTP